MVVTVQLDINVNQLPQTDFMFEKESFKATGTISQAPSVYQHEQNRAMIVQNGD